MHAPKIWPGVCLESAHTFGERLMRPLEHILILDLTHMVSGPYGAMLLTDLGARTIKVEPPGGEATRTLLRDDPDFSRDGMGAYFLTLNRGKKSVCIDLKHKDGHAVFLDLVRKADVVIDNFSVGVTERLGIDHERLAAVNPGIITCSITGFGQTGPEPHRPAFDQVVQAMGGGMSITGEAGDPPMRSGIPIGDLCGGLFGALGVLAALQARAVSGKGQHIDISMLDAQISLLNYMATMYLMSGKMPERVGNGHFVHVPYNCYPTQDGHIIIACIGDSFYQRVVDVFDDPELRDPAYRTQPGRYAAKARIDAILTRHLRGNTTRYWVQRLSEARVPCGPVNDFAQALTDPQVLARNMIAEVELESGEHVRMPGNPIKLHAAESACFDRPPAPGEHTVPTLQDLLGYDAERIARLRAEGVIA